MSYYHELPLDDRLALLGLIEKAARETDGTPEQALLAADRVLRDLGVTATLGQVGPRMRLCLGCSLRDLAIKYCEMELKAAFSNLLSIQERFTGA